MEEILKKANELGLMIKGSEISSRFEEISKQIENDSEAKKLLEDYIKMTQEFQEKEASGRPIEVEEKQKIQDISEKVSQNQLIKEFIATQTYFYNMMIQIQNVISDPKGDPIKDSKIITPGGGGKIITGI
ncbi:MAG: YlbF family regulator [Spirochaetes bacterium]|nr:YlbF family regulator [Spirochaetota bacterium]